MSMAHIRVDKVFDVHERLPHGVVVCLYVLWASIAASVTEIYVSVLHRRVCRRYDLSVQNSHETLDGNHWVSCHSELEFEPTLNEAFVGVQSYQNPSSVPITRYRHGNC